MEIVSILLNNVLSPELSSRSSSRTSENEIDMFISFEHRRIRASYEKEIIVVIFVKCVYFFWHHDSLYAYIIFETNTVKVIFQTST